MRRIETLRIISKNAKFYYFKSTTKDGKFYSAPIVCFNEDVIIMKNVRRDEDGTLSVGQDISCLIEAKEDGKEFVYANHGHPDYTYLGRQNSNPALSKGRKMIVENVEHMPASQQRKLAALIKNEYDGTDASVDKIADKAGIDLLPAEHHRLEIKACENDLNPKILANIAGFANAAGGCLLLGGEERDGNCVVVGCEKCIERYGGQDRFSCMLRNLCRQQISSSLFLDIDISFREVNGHTLCEISVPASKKVVFVNDELYVRSGNTTQHLKGDSILDWAMNRMISA